MTITLVGISGCSSDDTASGGKDATGSCKDLCTQAQFTSSRVDSQPNEINCFCTGTGTVTTSSCKTMCDGLGKAKSQAFKANASAANPDSCQCS